MKRRTKFVAGALGATSLMTAGGGYAAWYRSDYEVTKRLVAERLDDPESATFSDIRSCPDGHGDRIIIGEVNSRNQYGGMTGKRTFVVERFNLSPDASVAKEDSRVSTFADFYSEANILSNFGSTCTQIYREAKAMQMRKHADMDSQPMVSTDDEWEANMLNSIGTPP